MNKKALKSRLLLVLTAVVLASCKYFGSALPPNYPKSMDEALAVANDKGTGYHGEMRNIVLHPTRPAIDRPSYTPQKEMAVVAPPRTVLVWTYPHITDDNTRVFGNWSTIFLNDRYEWVQPAHEQQAPDLPGDF